VGGQVSGILYYLILIHYCSLKKKRDIDKVEGVQSSSLQRDVGGQVSGILYYLILIHYRSLKKKKKKVQNQQTPVFTRPGQQHKGKNRRNYVKVSVLTLICSFMTLNLPSGIT
jgi:hypothetical protein